MTCSSSTRVAGCLAFICMALPAVALGQGVTVMNRTVFAVPPSAVAGSGVVQSVPETASFEIAQHGHTVVTASYQFAPTPSGYNSTALVKIAMQGLDYALSKTEQLSMANELEHVQVSAAVNGEAVSAVASPDSAQFLLNISANGKSTTTRLTKHSATVFLADFDPGALETLLNLAANHNNRGLWVILPLKTGSIEPVQLATYADQQGTLDSHPILVHHMVATIAGGSTDLFSGPENQLLQAELPQEGFALIRKGFVLTPPARPIVPPNGQGQGTPPPSGH